MTKIHGIAVAALLLVGFMWGAAFVLMKDAIEQQPYMDFLAVRFTVAALAMLALRPRVSTDFQHGDIRFGAIIGAVLAFGYITQTIGLELTTAAVSGFLTGLYVVLTPILGWLVLKQKISLKIGIGALLGAIGLGVFSGAADSVEFQVGQLWLVACAVLYAVHILLLGKYGQGRNSYRFAMLQIAAVAVITWGFALVDGFQAPPNAEVWFAIIFTALLSTVFAFWIQTWAQTILEPSRVALLITSEVIFTAAIAVAVGQEPLTAVMVIGGGILLAAMLLVEWPTKSKPKAFQERLEF
jgi:drug/metabolite transporter (DMT)-like permease